MFVDEEIPPYCGDERGRPKECSAAVVDGNDEYYKDDAYSSYENGGGGGGGGGGVYSQEDGYYDDQYRKDGSDNNNNRAVQNNEEDVYADEAYASNENDLAGGGYGDDVADVYSNENNDNVYSQYYQ